MAIWKQWYFYSLSNIYVWVLFLFCVISLNRTLKIVLNNCDKMRTDRFSLKVSLLKVYVCACICKEARRGYQMSCSWSSGSWKPLLWLRETELKSPWRCTTGPSISLAPPSESLEEQSPVTHEMSSEHSRGRCSELCHKHWRRLQGQNKGPNEDSKAWDKWIMHHIWGLW